MKTTTKVAVITASATIIAALIGILPKILIKVNNEEEPIPTIELGKPSSENTTNLQTTTDQSTSGDYSPAINAGGDVNVNITKPETILQYEPPTINSFHGYHNESTFLELQDNTYVPITLTKETDEKIDGLRDYTIEFEILNKSKADLKIKEAYIEVVSVAPIEPIKYYVPYEGIGEALLYTCRIDGQPGKYQSSFGEPGKYLFLRSGEQETVKIAVNTKDEGKYRLSTLLKLSTVDGLKMITIGEVSDVRILKRSRIYTLPRN